MKAAVVYFCDPEVQADGGSLRVRALLRTMRELGHTTCLVTSERGPARHSSSAASGIHSFKRTLLPMPLIRVSTTRELVRALEREKVDGVVAVGLPHMPAALRFPAPAWLDFPDLWSEFGRREAAERHGVARQTARAQAWQYARRESSYADRAQMTSFAGFADFATAGARAGVFLPTPLSIDGVAPATGRVAGFLGNFHYWPNVDAYERLCRFWLPTLRADGWRVVVAGHGSLGLPAVDGVERQGSLEDVSSFYREAALVLAPVELGGGMKVKVVEALLAGRPVLATEHVSEGLPPHVGAGLRVVSGRAPLDVSDLHRAFDAAPAAPDLTDFGVRAFSARVKTAVEALV